MLQYFGQDVLKTIGIFLVKVSFSGQGIKKHNFLANTGRVWFMMSDIVVNETFKRYSKSWCCKFSLNFINTPSKIPCIKEGHRSHTKGATLTKQKIQFQCETVVCSHYLLLAPQSTSFPIVLEEPCSLSELQFRIELFVFYLIAAIFFKQSSC